VTRPRPELAYAYLGLVNLPLVLATGLANAQETRPSSLVGALPEERSAAGDPFDPGPALDPNLDRGFLQPTALTQPSGSLTYDNYEIAIHGISYGIANRLQASLTLVTPYVSKHVLAGNMAVKGQIFSGSYFHLAAQGSLGYANYNENGEQYLNKTVTAGSLGLLTSFCLDEACDSLFSLGATWIDGGDYGSALVYGGSWVRKVSHRTKVVFELSTWQSGISDLHVLAQLVSVGYRIHSSNSALHVGVAVFYGLAPGGPFILPIPLPCLGFSFRSL
jgi:hypothetical protein